MDASSPVDNIGISVLKGEVSPGNGYKPHAGDGSGYKPHAGDAMRGEVEHWKLDTHFISWSDCDFRRASTIGNISREGGMWRTLCDEFACMLDQATRWRRFYKSGKTSEN